MSTTPKATLCGKPLQGLMHTCAFVDSREEEYELLIPFLKEGIDCGCRVLTIVDEENRADHDRRLEHGAVVGERDGQLSVHGFKDTYLQEGCFSADRMLALIESVLDEADGAGYPAVRGFGEMAWALTGLPGTEQLLEYEARVNYLAPKMRNPLVCIYDVNRFSGRVLMDILNTHPKVILAGQVHDNPYYMPPDVYLKHLDERRRLRKSVRAPHEREGHVEAAAFVRADRAAPAAQSR